MHLTWLKEKCKILSPLKQATPFQFNCFSLTGRQPDPHMAQGPATDMRFYIHKFRDLIYAILYMHTYNWLLPEILLFPDAKVGLNFHLIIQANKNHAFYQVLPFPQGIISSPS